MSTAYTIVTIVAAAMAVFSGISLYTRLAFVVQPLTQYGVPRSWWPWLATAKTAGGVGLAAGLFIPVIGLLAAIGLVLYFIGAMITVARARVYSHISAPLLYLAPVVASLALS